SVGITARVLSEKGKLDSPEGVTILAGAVIDDVLGIIVLAVVMGLAKPGASDVHWTAVAGKAVGIWLGATIVLILLAKPIKRVLGIFRGEGVVPGLALGIALLLAGLMESAGLAMIIGAYVAGLALAKEEDLAHRLDRQLRPLYNVIVPVFFCVMGMLVDFEAMGAAVVFGLIFSAVAIVSKVVGCGLPTYLVKFNTRGALRVGFGMLPRGEVALIVAGVGLTAGIIGKEMFGVSIMMTLITTVMAPPILVMLFDGGPGIRGAAPPAEVPHREVVWRTRELAPRRLDLVMGTLVGALREHEEYDVSRVSPEEEIFLVTASEDDFDFQVVKAEGHVEVHASQPDQDRALGVTRSALAEVRSIFEDIAQEP
ncbi:MAG: cation:proton antiporter, partial [Planctomycetota bacterium]